jgi:hypothetical protein
MKPAATNRSFLALLISILLSMALKAALVPRGKLLDAPIN